MKRRDADSGAPAADWRVTEPFCSLPAPERDRIAPQVEAIQVDKDDILFREGDQADWVYFTAAGRIQLRHLKADGASRIVCQVGAGETFCCLPSMDGRPYPATASAASPGVVIRLPAAVFQEMLGRHPAFTAAALRQFCGRLREFGCESQAGNGSAAARIAEKLLRIAAHGSGEVALTRRELGEMAGFTVETTIRVTKDFERAGWVQLSRGRIRIADVASLESCARGEAAVPRTNSNALPMRLVKESGHRG